MPFLYAKIIQLYQFVLGVIVEISDFFAWLSAMFEQLGQLPLFIKLVCTALAAAVALICGGIAVGMGFASKAVNQHKGYSGGFAWGFWLDWVGLVIVACRTKRDKTYGADRKGDNPPPRPDALALMEADEHMWFCPSCGYAHPSEDSICSCGVRKKA